MPEKNASPAPVVSTTFTFFAGQIPAFPFSSDPAIGIRGAAYSTLLCYVLIAVLNLIAVARVVPEHPDYLEVFTKPLLATAVMAAAARAGFGLAAQWIPGRAAVLPAILFAAGVYAALVLAMGIIRRQDLAALPKGGKIADLLHLR